MRHRLYQHHCRSCTCLCLLWTPEIFFPDKLGTKNRWRRFKVGFLDHCACHGPNAATVGLFCAVKLSLSERFIVLDVQQSLYTLYAVYDTFWRRFLGCGNISRTALKSPVRKQYIWVAVGGYSPDTWRETRRPAGHTHADLVSIGESIKNLSLQHEAVTDVHVMTGSWCCCCCWKVTLYNWRSSNRGVAINLFSGYKIFGEV